LLEGRPDLTLDDFDLLPRSRRNRTLLLLHGGDETFPLARRVLAVPRWKVI
jgi:hypothetical protein